MSISTQFSSIWPIDRTLSGGLILGQSGPGNYVNEGAFWIPQISSIIGASPWDYLVLNVGHFLGESYFTAEMLSVYSATPADWAVYKKGHSIFEVAVLHLKLILCHILNVLELFGNTPGEKGVCASSQTKSNTCQRAEENSCRINRHLTHKHPNGYITVNTLIFLSSSTVGSIETDWYFDYWPLRYTR